MPTSIHAAGPSGERSPGLDAAIAGYLAENPPEGGASALDDLTDVDTTGQTTGDVLKYNGTSWVADAASAGTVTSTGITDSTATGRAVLTAADAAAARTAIAAAAAADIPSDALAELGIRSSNLFTTEGVLSGHVLPSGSATPTGNASYSVSQPIRVTAGQQYSGIKALRWTYVDSTGAYVGQHAPASQTIASTHTAPAGAFYVRLSIQNVYLATAQFNAGASLLAYEPGGLRDLPASILELPPIPDIETSPNLLNLDAAQADYTINSSTGAVEYNTAVGRTTTGWIRVEGGESYAIGGTSSQTRFAFYDIDREFISTGLTTVGAYDTPFTAPYNATWMRLAISSGAVATAYINQGTAADSEPFWVSVAGRRVPVLDEPVTPTDDRFMVDNLEGLASTYTAPTIPDYLDLHATTDTADVYGWFDALVTAHPGYVTRAQVGTASDAQPLYTYTFSPPRVPTEPGGTVTLTVTYPSVFLLAGIHGNEKTSVYLLYRIAKALCEDYGTEPVLDALHWNFDIVMLPVANPYGYDGFTRKNANGVDVARNFTEGWAFNADTGSPTYAGTEPLTEPESIAIDALFTAHAGRCVLAASFHNFQAAVDAPWKMMWNASPTDLQLRMGAGVISRMSRKWHAEHAWITVPQTHFGYSDLGAPAGSEGRQMRRHGINGSTFEVSEICRLAGAGVVNDSRALTLGMEALVAYIALGARIGLDAKSPA